MAEKRVSSLEHIINTVLILITSYIGLYLLLLFKTNKISNYVVPLIDGKPDYSMESLQLWLNSFDTLIYIMIGIAIVATIIRYIIEVQVITHEKTIFRSLMFLLIVSITEFLALIYFFKFKAPILNGDTNLILVYGTSLVALFYILIVAYVPSGIKYLMFPRNIIFRNK